MAEARLDLDIDAELVELALDVAVMAEDGAEVVERELKAVIIISPDPAPPGAPPHSRGPLHESFRHTVARRRGDRIVAFTYSMATTASGDESLAEVHDEGRGRNPPRPFIAAAIDRARSRVDAAVAAASARISLPGN